jgi:hypothetical protein
MLYMRSQQAHRDRSVATVRICTATSLMAYPCGALLLALGPETLATKLSGYGMILVAMIAYAPLIGTSLQRVVGEDAKVLDEYQLRLRSRALSASYMTFTALALLLVVYAAIASDNGLWVPATYEAFNGLFWGSSCTLPSFPLRYSAGWWNRTSLASSREQSGERASRCASLESG